MLRISNDEQAEIMYRVWRLNNHGYTAIHICGRWFLVRNWSKNGPAWYCKLPIYLPMRIKGTDQFPLDTYPSVPKGEFR